MSLKYRSKIGEKYALSIFSLCENENNFDKVYENLQKISDLLDDEKIYNFFDSKLVSIEKKYSLIDEFNVEIGLENIFVKFLKVLIKDNNINLYKSISWEFQNIYNNMKGIEIFEIIVAKSLDKNIKDEMKVELEKNFSKKIVLNESVDESIVGGMILKNRSKVFDDSVEMKLKNLKNHLLKGA